MIWTIFSDWNPHKTHGGSLRLGQTALAFDNRNAVDPDGWQTLQTALTGAIVADARLLASPFGNADSHTRLSVIAPIAETHQTADPHDDALLLTLIERQLNVPTIGEIVVLSGETDEVRQSALRTHLRREAGRRGIASHLILPTPIFAPLPPSNFGIASASAPWTASENFVG